MKNIITLAASLFSLTIFAQVGINNNTPKATLDITAQTTNGSKPEGLLAPRLTGDQIQAGDAQYTAAQAGIIIYATAAATAPSIKTANITAPGYYFYDGSAWQKLTSGAAVGDATTTAKGIVQLAGDLSGTAASPAIAANAVTSAKILDGTVANADLATGTGGIYKGSGSLSGSTTVTQGANTLAFTSTATNGFSVDGTTLSVDAANDRVGIGTISPTARLEINSPSTSALKIVDGTQSDGKVLTSDANGVATWQPVGNLASYHNVSAARSYETTYTNTTGREMKIFLTTFKTNSSKPFCHLSLVIDGLQLAYQNLDLGTAQQLFYIIPPGSTYRFVQDLSTSNFSGATIATWYEYY